MNNKGPYQPPYTLTPAILRLVAEIGEAKGQVGPWQPANMIWIGFKKGHNSASIMMFLVAKRRL